MRLAVWLKRWLGENRGTPHCTFLDVTVTSHSPCSVSPDFLVSSWTIETTRRSSMISHIWPNMSQGAGRVMPPLKMTPKPAFFLADLGESGTC